MRQDLLDLQGILEQMVRHQIQVLQDILGQWVLLEMMEILVPKERPEPKERQDPLDPQGILDILVLRVRMELHPILVRQDPKERLDQPVIQEQKEKQELLVTRVLQEPLDLKERLGQKEKQDPTERPDLLVLLAN